MENYDENDEISLIDLLSVLIKYRKFIILGTIIIFLLAGVFLFFLEKKHSENQLYNIDFTIPISSDIKKVNDLLKYNIENDVLLRLQNLNTIANFNTESKVFDYDFDSSTFNQLNYNEHIFNLVKDNKYIVELNSTKTNINIKLQTHSIENAENFISSLLIYLNEEYSNFIRLQIENRLKSLNDIIKNSNENSNNIAGLINEKIELESLVNSGVYVFNSDRYSFVLRENQSSLIKSLIVVFVATLFIFVFIAFLLNAIQNIKSDKKASEKIKLAWEDGKKIFPK